MKSHSTLREGFIAGAAGAVAVALWFLLADLVTARIFYTPVALGQAVAGLLAMGTVGPVAAFVGYTVLHFAAFAVLGIVSAAIIHRSQAEPTILAGTLLVFFIAEAAFYFFMFALHAGDLFGRFGWWQVTGANLLGWAVIGTLLWRGHPGLMERLDEGLGATQRKVD